MATERDGTQRTTTVALTYVNAIVYCRLPCVNVVSGESGNAAYDGSVPSCLGERDECPDGHRRHTGEHWRVINLSVSGGLTRDVLAHQIPLLANERPDLVTCGAGANDILFSAPAKLFADLRELLKAVPDNTVLLDLPLLSGFWGIVGGS